MRDGTRSGMRDTKKIRSGVRDEIILSGPGYAVFDGRDIGCYEIDGGIEDHKNHFMTEKTPNNNYLYERNNNLCISGLPVTYNQCVLLDPLPSPWKCNMVNPAHTCASETGLSCKILIVIAS